MICGSGVLAGQSVQLNMGTTPPSVRVMRHLIHRHAESGTHNLGHARFSTSITVAHTVLPQTSAA